MEKNENNTERPFLRGRRAGGLAQTRGEPSPPCHLLLPTPTLTVRIQNQTDLGTFLDKPLPTVTSATVCLKPRHPGPENSSSPRTPPIVIRTGGRQPRVAGHLRVRRGARRARRGARVAGRHEEDTGGGGGVCCLCGPGARTGRVPHREEDLRRPWCPASCSPARGAAWPGG